METTSALSARPCVSVSVLRLASVSRPLLPRILLLPSIISISSINSANLIMKEGSCVTVRLLNPLHQQLWPNVGPFCHHRPVS